MGNSAQEIEDALKLAEEVLPTVIGGISMFFPQAAALTPFLRLLPAAIQGVSAVASAVPGLTVGGAVNMVAAHNDPTQPNLRILNGDAQSAAHDAASG